AERTVAGAGVISEGELRTEPGSAGAYGNRNLERAGPRNRIGGEPLTDPADSTAASWQRDEWRLKNLLSSAGLRSVGRNTEALKSPFLPSVRNRARGIRIVA